MARKNRRQEAGFEPLDLTKPLPPRPASPTWLDSREAAAQRARWHEQMERRQRSARINQGIDWNVCLVPGCGTSLDSILSRRGDRDDHDHLSRLPMCLEHLAVAAKMAANRGDDPLMAGAVANVIERQQLRARTKQEVAKQERLARTDGFVYYIRLNGLIKVGWSRDLDKRIASYGPQVEVLAVHPGTRTDETNLHRQLKPARAVGREWYEDGPILADFIARAVEQHGPPPKFESPMTKPKQVVAGKRHR